ncbi:hypothetical protein KVR01_000167 [Diaporthe batatas]|uniref:uncharacterized protein n=1 Tax=Diaporthe batatas TaxID=748121 RepID=UPI001D05356E|nr:uncharacterized protein KVR01_000167 [Diaporthe batatas]KAG8169422.1 hypothetical protein KVR01_000167 [Diaporthe batatas]
MASNGNVNQPGYENRMQFVHQILQNHGLEPTSVEALAYFENCPFHFNNFIYKATLTSPATRESSKLSGEQPGTYPLPEDGTSVLVVRLSNPRAEGLNNANRVENEVAAQYLVRRSLEKDNRPPVVPAVYAWGSCRFHEQPDESGFGWSILEFKQGSDLDGVFPTLSREAQTSVMEQIADAFLSIQRARVPDSVTGFGSLTFSESGQIVTGEMPLVVGGPWDTYTSLWTAKLKAQVLDSDKSSVLRGWKDSDIRERLDSFLANDGVSRILGSQDISERVLVHGDLTMNNMLYDKEQGKLTAILDFDWACVTNPCDEFLSGFWDLGGGINEENASFQECIMTGDFSSSDGLQEMPAQEAEKRENGRVLNDAFARRGIIRPATIKAAGEIRKLRELENMVCPFDLSNEIVMRRSTEEARLARKTQKGKDISSWLSSAGF